MTSQKSSGNKTAVKRGSVSRASMYSYVTGLTSCLPSAIGIFLVNSIIFPGMAAYGFNTMKKAAEKIVIEGGEATKISDTLKYMMCEIPQITVFAIVATIILAVFAGISAFRFSADKRTVNVYYSLGIKRTSLFTARYLAGATMLLAATVIPIVICAIVNSVYIGVNSYLITATIYYSLGLFVSAMLAFSVTAAVFSSVGTIIEGIVFSAGVLLSPTVIIFAAQVFTSILYGAPYGDSYRLTDGTYVSGTANSLVSSLSAYNPVFFFINTAQDYVSAGIEKDKVILGENTPWTNPDFGLLFIWLAVTAAVFAGGMYLFRMHKAEKCGFIGTNKVLNTVLTFVFGFFAFAVCIYFLISKGIITGILAGCAVFAVIYTALELFLTRSFKLYIRKLWKLPVNLAVCCLVAAIFATGGFGYSKKLPAEDNIQKISLSVPLDTSVAGVYTVSFDGYGDGARFISHTSAILIPDLTEKSDFAFAEKIHKMLISDERAENKIPCDIVINYTLTDGSTLSRRYKSCSQSTYAAFAEYFDTKSCEDSITRVFTEKQHDDKSNLRMLNYGENNTAIAIASDFATQTVLELTESQWGALKAAIAEDLVAMTGEEYYLSGSRQPGMIMFMHQEDQDNEFAKASVFMEGDVQDTNYIQMIVYNMADAMSVTINEKMTKTLAYLESIGQKDCFVPAKAVKEVSFEPFKISIPEWLSDYYSITPLFNARLTGSDRTTTYYGENRQTDKGRIEQILTLSRLSAVSTDMSGYRVFIYFEDGTAVSKFLSKADAPDYVSSYTYPEVIMFDDR